jgi:menaquinone-specific isochorismate synthase
VNPPPSGGVRLLHNGRPIDADTLVAHTAPVVPGLLSLLVEHARRSGRIFEREGFSIAAIGEAATIDLPGGLAPKDAADDATGCLAAIPTSGLPPIALGAIAFDSRRPASFVIPAVSAIVRDGAPPVGIVVGEPTDVAELLDRFPFTDRDAPVLAREVPPDAFELLSVRSHADFRDRVAAAVAAIGRGEIDKVVLAREITVSANRPFAPGELIRRLRQLHPGCATFSIDGFLGASPELLIRLEGQDALSRPLAGTVARSGDPDQDAALALTLLGSTKERREHAFVVDAIIDTFSDLGAATEHSDTPHLLELRNVVHLASTIHASLDRPTSVLGLVAALHPTPAVAGHPRDAALAYLDRFEAFDRDRYAGAVGWFDGSGDGEFYIGIRSAIIDGSVARLIAGSGIVEGSDPDAELAETQIKLQALLAAAVRP